MWRSIGAVLVGYVVMFAVVFVSFSIAYLVLGTEGAFKPGSYEVSTMWIVISVALGFVAAVLGGLVCTLIAKSPRALAGLAGLVLVLGLVMAIPVLTTPNQETPATRGASVAMLDAMSQAQQPGWVALTNPVVGLVGVLLGGSLRSSRHASATVV